MKHELVSVQQNEDVVSWPAKIVLGQGPVMHTGGLGKACLFALIELSKEVLSVLKSQFTQKIDDYYILGTISNCEKRYSA